MSYWLHKAMSGLTTDKNANVMLFIQETLNKTQQMFKYTNLPTTIPQNKLETILQTTGRALIAEHDGHLYAFECTNGGKEDVYHDPTTYIVTNSALGIQHEYKVGIESVLMRNVEDMTPLIYKIAAYAAMQTEANITMRSALIMARSPFALEATDEAAYQAAKIFLEQIEDGALGVIETDPVLTESSLVSHQMVMPGSKMTDIIELAQYLKSEFWSDLGINLNENMKREYVNTHELTMNHEATKPLVDNMLACRQRAVNEINALYGLDITVELTSAWAGRTEMEEQMYEESEGSSTPEEVVSDTGGEEETSEEENNEEVTIKEDLEDNEVEAELENPLTADDVADTHRLLDGDEAITDELEVIENESTGMESERVETEEAHNQEEESETDEGSDSDEDNESASSDSDEQEEREVAEDEED